MNNPFRSRRGRVLMRLALYGGALLIGLPLAFSQVMIHPIRQPTRTPPAGWEEIRFSAEGLRLRGWLHQGTPSCAAVVVAHGVGDSLESYLTVGDVLKDRGHTVLLIDLRGHGGSQGSYTTLGGHEREDVRAAMDELGARGLSRDGIVLVGFSMGAVAALRAAVDRDDVRAVVVEAPFDTYRRTIAHHARLLYHLPDWFPPIPLAIAIAEWRAGFDADDVDAVEAARGMRAPLFAIADGGDARASETIVRSVWDAHAGAKDFWVAPGAEHVGALLLSEFWPRVMRFLEIHGI